MNKPKIYEFTFLGKKYNIVLGKGNYCKNGTLAVQMLVADKKGNVKDYFTDVTVNIWDSDVFANEKDTAFADTNNMSKETYKWLKKNKIIKEEGINGYSGYCTYPLVKFSKTALDGMIALD